MTSFVSSATIFPKSSTQSVEVDGIKTDIVCSTFSDYFFVVVTQIDKFGTILKAESAEKADGGAIYSVNTLLGRRDDPLLTIYARQLIERISQFSKKPLVLSISLQEEGRGKEHFEAIVNSVLQNITLLP